MGNARQPPRPRTTPVAEAVAPRRRADAPRNLVYIVDGTLSSLAPGCETHAGRLYRLLSEISPSRRLAVGYHSGVQGEGWRKWARAALGLGVNSAIRRGYGWLASRYRPGDRIFLIGYSRGAYAVRSLAGMIDRLGLLRAEHATERKVRRAFRYYAAARLSADAVSFRRLFCRAETPIEMIGAWETVKALGLPYPILSRISPFAAEFHDARLGRTVRGGYHALALDETRTAFAPVLWERPDDWDGRLEQVWFPGAHGDVGGERGCEPQFDGLAAISLNWMLTRLERHGAPLPADWETRFVEDPSGPMIGARRGIGAGFLLRARRRIPRGDGGAPHASAVQRAAAVKGYWPKATPEALSWRERRRDQRRFQRDVADAPHGSV